MVELKESATKSTTIFNNLDASEDNYDSGITELDSVCMNCYKTVRKKRIIRKFFIIFFKGPDKIDAHQDPLLSGCNNIVFLL